MKALLSSPIRSFSKNNGPLRLLPSHRSAKPTSNHHKTDHPLIATASESATMDIPHNTEDHANMEIPHDPMEVGHISPPNPPSSPESFRDILKGRTAERSISEDLSIRDLFRCSLSPQQPGVTRML